MMDALDKQGIIDAIEMAWAEVPYPGDKNIFTPTSYDDEGITEYFSGTDWRHHPAEDLRRRCFALSRFFTPPAFHYWLPAYLFAALENPLEFSQGTECLIDSFLPGRVDDLLEKMALLTFDQKLAVIMVFESLVRTYRDSSYPEDSEDPVNAFRYLLSTIGVE